MYETLSIPVELAPRYVLGDGKPHEVRASFEIEINHGFLGYNTKMVNDKIYTNPDWIKSLDKVPSEKRLSSVKGKKERFSSLRGNLQPSRLIYSPLAEMVDELLGCITELQLVVPQQGGSLLERITNDMKEELAGKYGINPEDVVPDRYYLFSSSELKIEFRPAREKNKRPVLPFGNGYFNPTAPIIVYVGLELPPTEPCDKLPGYKVLEIPEIRGTLIPSGEEKQGIWRFL